MMFVNFLLDVFYLKEEVWAALQGQQADDESLGICFVYSKVAMQNNQLVSCRENPYASSDVTMLR